MSEFQDLINQVLGRGGKDNVEFGYLFESLGNAVGTAFPMKETAVPEARRLLGKLTREVPLDVSPETKEAIRLRTVAANGVFDLYEAMHKQFYTLLRKLEIDGAKAAVYIADNADKIERDKVAPALIPSKHHPMFEAEALEALRKEAARVD